MHAASLTTLIKGTTLPNHHTCGRFTMMHGGPHSVRSPPPPTPPPLRDPLPSYLESCDASKAAQEPEACWNDQRQVQRHTMLRRSYPAAAVPNTSAAALGLQRPLFTAIQQGCEWTDLVMCTANPPLLFSPCHRTLSNNPFKGWPPPRGPMIPVYPLSHTHNHTQTHTCTHTRAERCYDPQRAAWSGRSPRVMTPNNAM
jgi:hypothetical protein